MFYVSSTEFTKFLGHLTSFRQTCSSFTALIYWVYLTRWTLLYDRIHGGLLLLHASVCVGLTVDSCHLSRGEWEEEEYERKQKRVDKSRRSSGDGCSWPHLLSKFKSPHTLTNTEQIKKDTTHTNSNRLTGGPVIVTSALCGLRCPT